MVSVVKPEMTQTFDQAQLGLLPQIVRAQFECERQK